MREDHSKVESGKATEPQNTVVTIDPACGDQNILVSFYFRLYSCFIHFLKTAMHYSCKNDIFQMKNIINYM